MVYFTTLNGAIRNTTEGKMYFSCLTSKDFIKKKYVLQNDSTDISCEI